MYRDARLSLVVPCNNEEAGIREVIRRCPPAVDDIIVVDSHSSDRTAEVARSLGATVVSAPRRGYGAAYKAGFAVARGELVATLDGDASYPPEAIPGLVDHLIDERLDFLSACRFPLADPGAMGLLNRWGNAALTAATVALFGTPLRDSQSGMWVFRRSVLERLQLSSDGMAFSQEIKLESILRGCRFGEAHIAYGDRIGQVKLKKWRDGWLNLSFLVSKRLRFGRRR